MLHPIRKEFYNCVGDYHIDTIYTEDDGWQTLIWTDGEVAVAEQYYNQNGAYFGHEKWMERCEAKTYGIFDVVKCHFVEM